MRCDPVSNPPARIWLCYGDIAEADLPVEHGECAEVSWCAEPVGGVGVEYVLRSESIPEAMYQSMFRAADAMFWAATSDDPDAWPAAAPEPVEERRTWWSRLIRRRA